MMASLAPAATMPPVPPIHREIQVNVVVLHRYPVGQTQETFWSQSLTTVVPQDTPEAAQASASL